MKQKLTQILILMLSIGLSTQAQTGYYGTYFIQKANANNASYDECDLSNALINADTSAIILETPNFSGGAGVYDPSATGVYYDLDSAKWAVYNETVSTMDTGLAFNILRPSAHGTAFRSFANAPQHNYTDIDNSATNGNPGAMVFATHYWGQNDGHSVHFYDSVPIGVWYNTISSKWSIFNERRVHKMDTGIIFNVFVADTTGGRAFVHTSTTGNIVTDNTKINNPLTNNNPNAVLIVTPNYSAPGAPHRYDSVPIGVYYDDFNAKWCIFHENRAPMDTMISFNVLVLGTATVNGISDPAPAVAGFKVYPNPSSGIVNISYTLAQSSDVKISLLSPDGREVTGFYQGAQSAGKHAQAIDGRELAPGLYYAEVSTANGFSHLSFVITK